MDSTLSDGVDDLIREQRRDVQVGRMVPVYW